jgi:hypothetical protein
MTVTTEQRRALGMLADAGPRGVPEALLVDVHTFDIEALAGLVRPGFASVVPVSTGAGSKAVTVVRMRIMDAGRQALVGRGGSARA